jgi:DNA-binding HxlR family transcriptional regulator
MQWGYNALMTSRGSSRGPKCPVAKALNIIGDTWTILILRDLFLDGPRKFQDLQQSLSSLSPNTLSSRLKKLEDNGIVSRRFYEQRPPRAEYVLTDKGRELGPVLKALREWGSKQTV